MELQQLKLAPAFLATNESNASSIHKSKLLSKEPIKTDLTKIYTGRLARAISNSLSQHFEAVNNENIAPYPIQSTFLSPLRNASIAQSKLDYVAFWSGQPSDVLKHNSVNKLFKSLIQEVLEISQNEIT